MQWRSDNVTASVFQATSFEVTSQRGDGARMKQTLEKVNSSQKVLSCSTSVKKFPDLLNV